MIAALREGFVNSWLLAKDLETIAAGSGDAGVAELCALIRASYDYPVDSVLVSTDLRVVGHLNVHAPDARDPEAYVRFLQRGSAAARGEAFVEPAAEDAKPAPRGPAQRATTLTPRAPSDSILDVVRPGPGLRYFALDATAFTGRGTIEVDVRLGGGAPGAVFELCAPIDGDPRSTSPVRTLELGPGESGKLRLEFEAGAAFGLAVKAGAGEASDANAFLAEVAVTARGED